MLALCAPLARSFESRSEEARRRPCTKARENENHATTTTEEMRLLLMPGERERRPSIDSTTCGPLIGRRPRALTRLPN